MTRGSVGALPVGRQGPALTPRVMTFLSTFISALIKNQNHWLIKF
jgi:hypothetical protein